MPAFSLRSQSLDGTTTHCGMVTTTSCNLLLIYHHKRMKDWVGLVGWPIADSLPTYVVTRRLQVKRRTAKACWSKTNVLPLCHRSYQVRNTAIDHNTKHSQSYLSHENSSITMQTEF